MMQLDRRDFPQRGRQIIGQRGGEDIPGFVVDDLFQQRIADALRDAAVDLAVDDHRIDQPAGVLRDQESFDFDPAGFDIDFDDRRMAGVRERARRIVYRGFHDAGLDLAVEPVRLVVGGARQTGDRQLPVGAGDLGASTLQHDVVGRRFQEMARELDQFHPHLAGSYERRAAGQHQRAARERAEAVGRTIGVAVHDGDLRRLDPELVGYDLGERGAKSLPVRARADARLDEARRVHRQLDLLPAGRDLHPARGERRRAVAGALREGRKAESQKLPLCPRLALAHTERGDVERGSGDLHRLPVARLVEGETRHRRVGKAIDQVAATDLDGIEIERGRGAVHQPLQRQRDRRTRHAPIRRHRARVGEHAARHAGIGANVVGPRQLGQGHQRLDRTGRGKAGIGPDVGGNIGRKRDELADVIEGALDSDFLVAAVERRDQIFAPVLPPRHRAFQPAREPHQKNKLGRQRHLLPKPAADVRRDDAQLRFRHADQIGDRGAHQMRGLGRAGEENAAGSRIVGGMAAARLERHGVLPP